ncbi:MAG: ABC transporter ATP-binding protein [Bacteroidia bacterium]|nr:ABC transporter ATP-binding protein [Bacteroidia bacterium]
MNQVSFFDSLKKVFIFFYNSGKHKFAFVLLVSFLSMIIDLIGLYLLYLVISSLLQGKETFELWFGVITFPIQDGIILFGIFYLFKFAFSVINSRLQIKYCFSINKKITSHLIKYYYSLRFEELKAKNMSDILNKVFTIGGFFSELIFQTVIILFTDSILSAIILVLLLLFNYKILILLVFILVPISIVLIYNSRKKLSNSGNELMRYNENYHQTVVTLMHGIFDIKISGRFNHFFKEFTANITKLHNTKKVIFLENSYPSKVLELVVIFGIIVLFFISRKLDIYTNISSLMAAFATASFRLIPSVNRIISGINYLKIYKNYIDFIDTTYKKQFVLAVDSNIEDEQIKSIELKNISFSYSENKVINDISLKLNIGEITLITGKSGSGKTTLINIISGLIKTHSGEILINEKPINNFGSEFIFQKTAYVMQEPFFFYGTVWQNIAFGNEPIDINRIMWCIKAVKMDEWVNKQSKGIDTIIGDRATMISGGQKQRLAIARALYRKINILILDEPSSSLDFENKNDIISFIKDITKNEKLITIIVSHDKDVININDKTIEIF